MISHNGALIMKPHDVEAVMSTVNAAKTLLKGHEVVVCRHTWANVEKLRRIGLKPPSLFPYEQWEYTGRFTPMAHQRKTVEFLTENPRAFVLSDMGTCKTASALWAVEYLMQRGVIRRVLIISPISVMGVWVSEILSVCPHRGFSVLHGSRQKRLDLLANKTDINIINHDGVTTLSDEIKKEGFDLIIADEAHAYRNAKTRRYKVFREIAHKVQRLWLLTGTPTPAAPTDAWALVKLVDPKKFAGGFGAFKELTMRKISQFLWIPRDDSSQLVYQHMQPAIRFAKEDCLDLPPLTYVNRECELTSDQRKAFNSMRKTMAIARDNESVITAANAAVMLFKLVQISCGVVRDNEQSFHKIDDSNRIDLLKECIVESSNKAIVFVPFIGVMDRIKEQLEKEFTCAIVNGQVSRTDRQDIFNEFQRGKLQVLLAHPRTTAHGLTLTASNTIIWYAPIFSAEQYSQANARIHRPGQKNPCTIVHIGASRLEWDLYETLEKKLRLQDAILRQYEELTR